MQVRILLGRDPRGLRKGAVRKMQVLGGAARVDMQREVGGAQAGARLVYNILPPAFRSRHPSCPGVNTN